MKFALKVAMRFLSARKKSLVQKISNICIITVIVSIAVPILVLSVFGGFHKNVGNKLLTVEGDIKILPPYIDFTEYNEVIKDIKNSPSVSDYIDDIIPYFDAYGIIKKSNSKSPTRILAIPESFFKKSKMYHKEFVSFDSPDLELPELKEHSVILGNNVMNSLLVSPYSKISIYLPLSFSATSIDLQENSFEVAGSFLSGYNKYEDSLVIMRLEDVSSSFGIQNYATGIMVYLKDHSKYSSFVAKLKKLPFLSKYRYSATQDEGLFIDFKREKGLMRIALLILVFASFMTIYITLNVVVLDKQKEIGIMKAFGVNSTTVSRIFIIEGFLIGSIGAFIGVMLGMFMAVNLTDIIKAFETIVSSIFCTFFDRNLPFVNWFNLSGDCHITIIDSDTFYITNMPSDPQLIDALIQTIGAIIASVLAAYFTSTRAAKQKPIETLMHK